MYCRSPVLVMLAIILALLSAAAGSEPLPALNANLYASSVSGVSSGADMAHQLHISHSSIMAGAGLVSVAPYHCAEGQVTTALARCMKTRGIDAKDSLAHAQAFEGAGAIDPLDNLQNDRVYLFAGTEDTTRVPAVVHATTELYLLMGVPGEQIHYHDDLQAGHAFITEAWGNARCEVSASPFINDCDYDQAGAILQWIYGPLHPPARTLTGSLRAFDQREFLSKPEASSMAQEGFVYIPTSCEQGGCRVHVALHGCRQGATTVDDAFYRHAGYNRWADTNGIIVLYPQAQAMTATFLGMMPDVSESNSRGCWNWWGYGDDAHYSRRHGVQIRAIRSMIDRLSAGG